ncbi:MAG: tetratricopeptide repeat protein [FCB group bacterium]|nr:tetratricopeptide repeat protein [FCB group bacterium]
MSSFLWPMIAVGLFIIFRISVHSMGDGYLRDIEIRAGKLYYATEMLDFFIHATLYKFITLFGKFRPTVAMAATSIVAGVVFVYILFRNVTFEGWKRYLFIGFVLSLGCSQFFFGYAESYTLVYLFSVWYLLSVFRESFDDISFGVVIPIYLLAGFSHQLGVILLPSFLYLAYLKFNDHSRRLIIYSAVAVTALLPLLIPRILNQYFDADEIIILTDSFLPLWDSSYGIFTPNHLFDLINEFLLVAPAFLLLLPFMPLVWKSSRRRIIMAATIVLPSFLFILVFDPKLTMVRDWDLFSVPMALGVIPLAVLIFEPLDNNLTAPPKALIGAVLVSMVVLSSWLFLNHNAEAHLKRAEYFLDRAERNQSWGYEVLAKYYEHERDYTNELRILDKINPADRKARMYGNVAQSLYSMGRYDEAYEAAMEGMELPNPVQKNFMAAGITSIYKKEFDQAARFLLKAVQLTPNDPEKLNYLGAALSQGGHPDEAIEVFQKAIALNRNFSDAYFGLAFAYNSKQEKEIALQYCRRGLELAPGSSIGKALMRQISEGK